MPNANYLMHERAYCSGRCPVIPHLGEILHIFGFKLFDLFGIRIWQQKPSFVKTAEDFVLGYQLPIAQTLFHG